MVPMWGAKMRQVCLLGLVMSAVTLFGSNQAESQDKSESHGTIKIQEEKSGKAGSIKLQIMVQPNEGLKLNFDAPWRLELLEAENIQFVNATLGKNDLDQASGAFRFNADLATKKPQAFKYKLTAFICTKDIARCYRQVFEGQHKIGQ